jgi:hypothetical protein
MLYFLTICETFISMIWIVNGFAFYNVKKIKDNCGACFINSLISIFIQNFEWIFFTCTLHNLLCFFDPIKEENYRKRLRIYFLISLVISCLYTFIIFITGIYGISVYSKLHSLCLHVLFKMISNK